EVRDFWIARLRAMPLPPESADAAGREARQAEIVRRKGLIREIRGRKHDVAARLVCLSHNVGAWNLQGKAAEAEKAERSLLRLRECLAAPAPREITARRRATDRDASGPRPLR